MLSRCTIGATESKTARAVSPVAPRIASASAGEVSGPVATITLSQSSGGRPAISSRAVSISGCAASAAARPWVGPARRVDGRAEPPHLLVQQADRVGGAVVGAERVRAHELGETV